MIRYMLDSSFCIDVMRDRTELLREKFKINSNQMAISTIVLHELFFGAAINPEPDRARGKVEKFCTGVSVLSFDDKAAAHAGDIRSVLRRKGQTIGGYDTLIAGHARSLGLTVVTGNLREFSRVDGLRCEDWLAD
jgi:tRNA(fMet)-specific endonuclease VapC